MLKLNKIFYSSVEEGVFYDRIQPTAEQRTYLVSCKNDIRDHLRPRIRRATVEVLGMDRVVEPRFRTQGSWSYNTCVQPVFRPPQEMDWDFGVYLPVSVWEENGPPHEMAPAYFELVEGLLQDLCRDKGWTLISGKDMCIRVQVASWAHIDIPLYAAPEGEFEQILEKAALESASFAARAADSALDFMAILESAEFGEMPEQAWDDLDHIVMATRKGEWKASDPEAVSKWFSDKVQEHGEQLRRVSRYLKAWRDYHWEEGGPTSVSIMVAIAQAFEVHRARDDIALEKSALRLGNALLGEIRERGIDDGAEDFNKRLSAAEKTLAAQKARALAQALLNSRTLAVHQKGQAIEQVRTHLGDRIPVDVALIDIDNSMDDVRSIPPQRVAAPVVLASSAG